MKFIKAENYEELSKIAGDIVINQIKEKPDTILGLATGSSPIGTYKYMANSGVDFSKVKSVNLDEYVGLDGNNEQSYRYFMNKHLFNHINIDKNNTFVPNGAAKDLDEEARLYDERIEAFGGIDLQILGIGIDGHIGFNEPDDVFVAPTHVVSLDSSTIEANSRFFTSKDEVPRKAITMGMKAIMSAKKIVLVANGKNKKEILEKAIYGEITPRVPASILQLHNDITVIYSEE